MLPRSSATLAIAPAWHTGILVLVFAASGFFATTGAPASQAATALAQAAIAAMLAAYVAAGMYLRGHPLRELIGRFQGVDLLWAGLTAALLLGLWLALGPSSAASGPRTLSERALWIAVSAVVAFGEELVFRGYLQRQFEALGLGFWLAAVAQAALFAAAHAGPAALYAGVCGLALALLARARGGLCAATAAHFALDACASFWP